MSVISPDEQVFREHISNPRFLDGVHRGRWRIEGETDWPYVVISVSAAQRDGAPPQFYLRFDLSNYPISAPTVSPWNPETGRVLEPNLRPKGANVAHVFRSDWEEGKALYAPFDRVALQSHPDWQSRYPRRAWDSQRDIIWVLQYIHEILNCDDYEGI